MKCECGKELKKSYEELTIAPPVKTGNWIYYCSDCKKVVAWGNDDDNE